MSDNTNSNDMLKLLITAAVTVAGSYMSISAHIDKSISAKVDEAVRPIIFRVDAVKYYADSLHRAHRIEIEELHKRRHR